jgi:hypothetical protein
MEFEIVSQGLKKLNPKLKKKNKFSLLSARDGIRRRVSLFGEEPAFAECQTRQALGKGACDVCRYSLPTVYFC